VLRKFTETGPVALADARPQWERRELEVRPTTPVCSPHSITQRRGGPQDLRRTAHSMKGSSGYLKASELISRSIALMSAAEAAMAGDDSDVPDALAAWEEELQAVISHVEGLL